MSGSPLANAMHALGPGLPCSWSPPGQAPPVLRSRPQVRQLSHLFSTKGLDYLTLSGLSQEPHTPASLECRHLT